MERTSLRNLMTRRMAAPLGFRVVVVAGLTIVLVLSHFDAGPASAGARADPGEPRVVNISGYKFEPRVLKVRAGARVRFENSSYMTHTATDEGVFNTGDIRPGRSAVVRLGRKGVYAYHCLIHPFMRGKIIVR